MAPIIRTYWGGALGLTILWLLAAPDFLAAEGIFAWRQFLTQYSGVLSIAAMSAAMILAIRPHWPEARLGGLDKMYRLHKWLGIGGLVTSVGHWLIVNGPRWAVGWGWLARPERGARPPPDNAIEVFFMGLRDPAEGLGNFAFYVLVALTVVSLIKFIPYGIFRRLHRLFPIVYLVLVFHSVVLTDFDYWLTPLGLALATLIVAGSYTAAVSLLGLIGAARRVKGKIIALESFPGVHALRSAVKTDPGWPGHAAGQFAFVTSDRREGAHPYTIASGWDPANREIVFITKALGDHTARLPQTLKLDQEVMLEGPYGAFTFEDQNPVQIWVGAGVGITPFIARMQHLAQHGGVPGQSVHLFHTTAEVDEAALARLEQDARASGILLHVLIDVRDGLLTGDRIRQAVPEWRKASIWFCGPTGFGAALRRDFASHGLDVHRQFHQELFEMR
jgi:predicted ferric reductase